jgi:hypothetical protein
MLSVIGCLIAVLLIHHVPRELRRSGYILTGLVVVGFVVLILMQRNRRGAERNRGRGPPRGSRSASRAACGTCSMRS